MNTLFVVEISFGLSTLFFLFACFTILPAFSFPIIPHLSGHRFGRIKAPTFRNLIRNTGKGFGETLKYLQTSGRTMRTEWGGGSDALYKKNGKFKTATLYRDKGSEQTRNNSMHTLTATLSWNSKNVDHRDIAIPQMV